MNCTYFSVRKIIVTINHNRANPRCRCRSDGERETCVKTKIVQEVGSITLPLHSRHNQVPSPVLQQKFYLINLVKILRYLKSGVVLCPTWTIQVQLTLHFPVITALFPS
jgi:hypothetical protein